MHIPRTPSFRQDINGLRAWAVASVVLYHFGLRALTGGFQGVDVFFVISGFLMTGLVAGGLERDGRSYSILGFYLARARRIIPALIPLILLLLAIGWFVLPTPDYKKLADHTVSSLLFFSNLRYLHESGYFDSLSHEKWLLHTWSLSVEWQFYLLFPVLMKLLWRWMPSARALRWSIAVLLVSSWVACAWITTVNASQAFYWLSTRAWQMLAGAGVCLLAVRPTVLDTPSGLPHFLAKSLYWLGFAMVFWGMAVFTGNDPWPGWRALFPVMGTCLVLMSSHEQGLLTRPGIVQWLGDRSYSIYLWHWPLVVAMTYLEWLAHPGAIVAGVVLTLFLANASYRWIETPARQLLAAMNPRRAFGCVMMLVLIPLCMALLVLVKKGVPGRVAPLSEQALAEQLNRNPRYKQCHDDVKDVSPSCVYGGPDVKAIVVGDSHANAIVTAVAKARLRPEDGVLEWSHSACPVLMNAHIVNGRDASQECHAFMKWAIQQLDSQYDGIPVVIISRWAQYALGRNERPSEANIPYVHFGDKIYPAANQEFLERYAQDMVQTACHIAKRRKVYLLRPVPEMKTDVPTKLARVAIWGGDKDVRISWADYMGRQRWFWAAQDRARQECGVEILDSTASLCRDGHCYGVEDGRSLYYDDDHLSEFGNKKLTPLFGRVFNP